MFLIKKEQSSTELIKPNQLAALRKSVSNRALNDFIDVTFNDKTTKISKDILKVSSLLENLYEYRTINEPLPLYELDSYTFEILCKFLEINKDFKKYRAEDFIYVSKNFISQDTKKFLSNFDTETLLKLLKIGLSYEIYILAETVAFIISLRYVDFYYASEKIHLAYFNKKIPIDNNVALCIIKYLNKNVILSLSRDILLKFNYNPIFDSKYDNLFNISFVFLNDISEIKNVDYDDIKIVLKYGFKGDYDDRIVKILNVKLLPENIHNEKIFEVPSDINTIGENCFENKNVQKIILNDGLENIFSHAFKNCTFENILLPTSLTHINDFENCKKLNNIDLTYLKNMPTFINCYELESITFPKDIKIIPEDCFKNCNSLKSIEIPTTVTYIGANCFENCTSLTSIEIPKSVKALPENCFKNCHKLSNVTKFKIKTFGENCFAECSSLVNLKLTSDLTELPKKCFINCNSLASITLPDSITSIGESCFENCNSLKNVKLSINLRKIPKKCFFNCALLNSIDLEDVSILEESCFKSCLSLDSISLINADIHPYAFENCVTIKNATLYQSVLFEGCFKECIGLTSIDISAVKTIPKNCFEDCSNLSNIVFPKSIFSISDYAFLNCKNLENVTFENTNVSITKTTFEGCKKLKTKKYKKFIQ